MSKLTYEEREDYACKVCQNVPDEEGLLEHGKGCYTQSEDGGGDSWVEFEYKQGEALFSDKETHEIVSKVEELSDNNVLVYRRLLHKLADSTGEEYDKHIKFTKEFLEFMGDI